MQEQRRSDDKPYLGDRNEFITTMAQQTTRDGDDGTNDVLVSNVIRTNEAQVWFVAEHLVDEPLVHAEGSNDRAR